MQLNDHYVITTCRLAMLLICVVSIKIMCNTIPTSPFQVITDILCAGSCHILHHGFHSFTMARRGNIQMSLLLVLVQAHPLESAKLISQHSFH